MTLPVHNQFRISETWEMLTSFLEQEDDHPNLYGVIRALGLSVQRAEDMLISLLYDRMLTTALGTTLDWLAEEVGAYPRSWGGWDLTDEEFRGIIRARIVVNLSNGEPEVLLWLVQEIAGADRVFLAEVPSAAQCRISYWVSSPLSEGHRARLRVMMDDAKAAGVRLDLTEGIASQWFGFAGSDALGFDEGRFGGTIPRVREEYY